MAMRLIPRCTGARLLFPRALSLVFCLRAAVSQDQLPNNKAGLEHDLQVEMNITGLESRR